MRGVFARALRTARRHWRPLFIVALAIFVPIGLLEVLDHHVQETGAEKLTSIGGLVVVIIAVSDAVTALLGEILFAGVIAAAVSETHGGRIPTLAQIVRNLPYLTLIAIDLLFSIGLAFTLLLLVLPGVYFFGCFALAAPIAKIEHVGVRAAFARSRGRTRGHVGLVLVVLLPLVLGGQALGELAVAGAGELTGDSFFGEWAGATLAEMIAAPLWALGAVALTYELLENG